MNFTLIASPSLVTMTRDGTIRNRIDRAVSWLKRTPVRSLRFLNNYVLYMQRLSLSSSRGALGAETRNLDPTDARTWEFSAFSQNGEDGITEHLTSLIDEPNRYFLEIGAADGIENNSTYLALVKKYNGIMVEGSRFRSAWARTFLKPQCAGVEFLNRFVTESSAPDIVGRCRHPDPDFFSLDIDGMDFYVLDACFRADLHPKVACLEYNSAYGPDRAVTVPYADGFDIRTAHPSQLYYGVSLAGWKQLMGSQGYEFITVDSNGVNAFFANPDVVDLTGLAGLKRFDWRENVSQRERFHCEWAGQFELIKDQELVEIA